MSLDTETFHKEGLQVNIFKKEADMAEAAADFVVQILNKAISKNGKANLILATGTSQFSFLAVLKKRKINWEKVVVFHLDEYKDLSDQHPASFRKYLNERILDEVKPGTVHLINGDAKDLRKEIESYEELLKSHPVDIACIGIGENGHIAFNDPPVADFKDPHLVKIVELDEQCRNQQMGEGWFPTLDEVPKYAVTLTITAIMNCKSISCVVPGKRKSEAIRDTLIGEISTHCPATILRNHSETKLFLDEGSASMYKQKV